MTLIYINANYIYIYICYIHIHACNDNLPIKNSINHRSNVMLQTGILTFLLQWVSSEFSSHSNKTQKYKIKLLF